MQQNPQQPPYFPPQQSSQPYQQQPYPPQAPMPPARKRRPWGWILALVLVFFVGYGIGHAGSAQNSSTATTGGVSSGSQSTAGQQQAGAPQKPLTWKTTHTFTGDGAKKTETFTVGDDWKINWSCQGVSGIDAPLFITPYKVDGNTPLDTGSQTTCKASDTKTTGGTEEHQGGKVYLDINSGIAWTITVQELK